MRSNVGEGSRMRGKLTPMLAVVAAVALACVCALCACTAERDTAGTNGAGQSDEDLPELRIGVDMLEPYFYIDRNGQYSGIDADIAKEACRRAGLKPTFVQIDWAERDSYLANGTVDCLWTAFTINGRENAYCWTTAYAESDMAVLVDSGNPSESLEDFNGPGGVAVRANSVAERFFLNGAGLAAPLQTPVHAYGTFSMAQAAFVKGYTDALVGHKAVLDQLVESDPHTYRYLDACLATLRLGVAFPLGSERDAAYLALDAALREMAGDGTISAVQARYDTDSDAVAQAESAPVAPRPVKGIPLPPCPPMCKEASNEHPQKYAQPKRTAQGYPYGRILHCAFRTGGIRCLRVCNAARPGNHLRPCAGNHVVSGSKLRKIRQLRKRHHGTPFSGPA